MGIILSTEKYYHPRTIGTPNEVLGTHKCPTCKFRKMSLYSDKCRTCIFVKGENFPNYQLDPIFSKVNLDDFTPRKYPQYSSDMCPQIEFGDGDCEYCYLKNRCPNDK